MRLIILMTFLLALILPSSRAQAGSFELLASGSFSDFTVEGPGSIVGSNGVLRFGGGASYEFEFVSGWLGLELGALWQERRYTFDLGGVGGAGELTRSFKGIRIPLLFRIPFGQSWSFGLGGYLYQIMGDTVLTSTTDSLTQPLDVAGLKKTDLGLEAGLRYDFFPESTWSVFSELRYSRSLANASSLDGDRGRFQDFTGLLGIRIGGARDGTFGL